MRDYDATFIGRSRCPGLGLYMDDEKFTSEVQLRKATALIWLKFVSGCEHCKQKKSRANPEFKGDMRKADSACISSRGIL